MEQSLIANSGIQLCALPLTLDLGVNERMFFREWFDEDEVQTNLEYVYQLEESEKVVRVADLVACRFLDGEGRLLVSENEVLANPNIEVLHEGDISDAEDFFTLRLNDKRRCALDRLLGQWLPLPYYEVDGMGNFKDGPYNWVRCKLLPQSAKAEAEGDGERCAEALAATMGK